MKNLFSIRAALGLGCEAYLKLILFVACSFFSINSFATGYYQNISIEDALLDYKNGNYDEALYKFTTLSYDNNLDAKLYLGIMLSEGTAGKINQARALKLFKEVSENTENITAYAEYAVMLSNLGGDENKILAKYWFKKVEENLALFEKQALNDPFAQTTLGLMYDTIDTLKNPTKYYYWINRAAENDHPQGLYQLALMYEFGLDNILKKNQKKSFDLTQRAHEKGLVSGTIRLALYYENYFLDSPAVDNLSDSDLLIRALYWHENFFDDSPVKRNTSYASELLKDAANRNSAFANFYAVRLSREMGVGTIIFADGTEEESSTVGYNVAERKYHYQKVISLDQSVGLTRAAHFKLAELMHAKTKLATYPMNASDDELAAYFEKNYQQNAINNFLKDEVMRHLEKAYEYGNQSAILMRYNILSERYLDSKVYTKEGDTFIPMKDTKLGESLRVDINKTLAKIEKNAMDDPLSSHLMFTVYLDSLYGYASDMSQEERDRKMVGYLEAAVEFDYPQAIEDFRTMRFTNTKIGGYSDSFTKWLFYYPGDGAAYFISIFKSEAIEYGKSLSTILSIILLIFTFSAIVNRQ